MNDLKSCPCSYCFSKDQDYNCYVNCKAFQEWALFGETTSKIVEQENKQ